MKVGIVRQMRPYNFGAGPATLPQPILEQAQAELLDWQGTGMSVMEIGHRTPAFKALLAETAELFGSLLSIPQTHCVLLCGFPARFQFSMIPMSFLKESADYLVTGIWSRLAYEEANRKKPVRQLKSVSTFDKNADYFYYTPNETISGYAHPVCPEVGEVPLIADMTSCLLSAPLDVSPYDLIFAGAQKNIGPPGLTVVIARNSFLDRAKTGLDTLCDYRTHRTYESNYATPPNFSIYMANLMCHWLKEQGGLVKMGELNHRKASILYEFIDNSDAYLTEVPHENRSMMNVVFTLGDESLTETFLAKAASKGLLGLKGHRAVGGVRASLYNAMPIEGVYALRDFMADFVS
jgi:phosphoserine aminotransferase